MFTALAEKYGDLDQKLNYFAAMAPVTVLSHSKKGSYFHYISGIYQYLVDFLEEIGIYEIYGPTYREYIDDIKYFFPGLSDVR